MTYFYNQMHFFKNVWLYSYSAFETFFSNIFAEEAHRQLGYYVLNLFIILAFHKPPQTQD